jgi:hypothetical protein
VWVDWVFVANYTDPEPLSDSWGSEEDYETPPTAPTYDPDEMTGIPTVLYSGVKQFVSLYYTDVNGWENLNTLDFMIDEDHTGSDRLIFDYSGGFYSMPMGSSYVTLHTGECTAENTSLYDLTVTWVFTINQNWAEVSALDFAMYGSDDDFLNGGWLWNDFNIPFVHNDPPTADSADIVGEPATMYSDTQYTIYSYYNDTDGYTQLDYVLFAMSEDHVTEIFSFRWTQETDIFSIEDGGSYGELNTSQCSAATSGNVVNVTWVFTPYEAWTVDIIDYGVYAIDNATANSGWDWNDFNTIFSLGNIAPTAYASNIGGQINRMVAGRTYNLTSVHSDSDGWENIDTAYISLSEDHATARFTIEWNETADTFELAEGGGYGIIYATQCSASNTTLYNVTIIWIFRLNSSWQEVPDFDFGVRTVDDSASDTGYDWDDFNADYMVFRPTVDPIIMQIIIGWIHELKRWFGGIGL